MYLNMASITVNIEDITLSVDDTCICSYPCQHFVSIGIGFGNNINNEEIIVCLSGPKLYILTKYLKNEYFEHFKHYRNRTLFRNNPWKKIRKIEKDGFIIVEKYKIVFKTKTKSKIRTLYQKFF